MNGTSKTTRMTMREYNRRRALRLLLRFAGLAVAIICNFCILGMMDDDSVFHRLSWLRWLIFGLYFLGAAAFILSFCILKLPRLHKTYSNGVPVCAKCGCKLMLIPEEKVLILNDTVYCDVCAAKIASGQTDPFPTPPVPIRKTPPASVAPRGASASVRTPKPADQVPETDVRIDLSTGKPRPADIPYGLELTPDALSMRLTAVRTEILGGLFFSKDPTRLHAVKKEMIEQRDLCCTELLWLMHETDFRIQLCKYHEPEDLKPEDLTDKIPELTESKALLRGYVLRRLADNSVYAFVRREPEPEETQLALYTHKSKVNAVIGLLGERAAAYTIRTVSPRTLHDAVREWTAKGFEKFTVDGQPDVFRFSELEALPRPDASRVEAQPAQTRAETPDEPHPDDIPDSLLFMPNELYMKLKDSRRNELSAQFFGPIWDLNSVTEEQLTQEHLSCTELIWLMEACDEPIDKKLSEQDFPKPQLAVNAQNRALLRSAVLRQLTGNDCWVILRKPTDLPLPLQDRKYIALYTHQSKAEAVAKLLDRHANAKLHSVRKLTADDLREAAERWQAEGYEAFNIDGKLSVFRLSEISPLPDSVMPRNPALCRAILGFLFTVYTGRDDIFFSHQSILDMQGRILDSAKEGTFLALRSTNPITGPDGLTVNEFLRPINYEKMMLALWTDPYAMRAFLAAPNRQGLEKEICTVTFREVLEQLQTHPFNRIYGGIVINPDSLTYMIPIKKPSEQKDASENVQESSGKSSMVNGKLPNGVLFHVEKVSDGQYVLELHDPSGNHIADPLWMPGQAGTAIFALTEDEYLLAVRSEGENTDPAFLSLVQSLMEKLPKDRLLDSFYINIVTHSKTPMKGLQPNAETMDDFKYPKWKKERTASAVPES